MEHDAKRQSRLARDMRDPGVPPDRDLWPEIDAAITREETRRSVRSGGQAIPWPRLIAVAAALTVLLAAGWAGVRIDRAGPALGPVADRAVAEAPQASYTGLDVIDNALDELNRALAGDPENQNLTRLVLMIHQKRGDLLRRTIGNPDLN